MSPQSADRDDYDDYYKRVVRVEALLRALHRGQFGSVDVTQDDLDEAVSGTPLKLEVPEPGGRWWPVALLFVLAFALGALAVAAFIGFGP